MIGTEQQARDAWKEFYDAYAAGRDPVETHLLQRGHNGITSKTVSVVLDEYLASDSRPRHTQQSYESLAKRLKSSSLGQMRVCRISAKNLLEYRDERAAVVGPSTIKMEIQILRRAAPDLFIRKDVVKAMEDIFGGPVYSTRGRRGSKKDGLVYFLQDPVLGEIKIGWTSSLECARRKSLQTGNPRLLKLLATTPADSRIAEKTVHEAFDHLRIRELGGGTEWFTPATDLMEFIAAARAGSDLSGWLDKAAA